MIGAAVGGNNIVDSTGGHDNTNGNSYGHENSGSTLSDVEKVSWICFIVCEYDIEYVRIYIYIWICILLKNIMYLYFVCYCHVILNNFWQEVL